MLFYLPELSVLKGFSFAPIKTVPIRLYTDTTQTETQIETALISHLQKFLMELGKGFAFVARQQHIVTDTSNFFIDLVFYNYYLKCFVLVDLKTHKLTHEAIQR